MKTYAIGHTKLCWTNTISKIRIYKKLTVICLQWDLSQTKTFTMILVSFIMSEMQYEQVVDFFI